MDHFAHIMQTSAKSSDSRIVLSADCRPNQARNLLRDSRHKFAAVKMHPETAKFWGMRDHDAIEFLKRAAREGDHKDMPVILDAKLADVPHMNAWKATQHFKEGYEAITCHCFPGEASIKAVMEVARNFGRGVLPVVSTSSPGNFFTEKQIWDFTNMCARLEVSGIVSGGNNIRVLAHVRQLFGSHRLIFSPGIGAQGGDERDALKHANFVIIGRRYFNGNQE